MKLTMTIHRSGLLLMLWLHDTRLDLIVLRRRMACLSMRRKIWYVALMIPL